LRDIRKLSGQEVRIVWKLGVFLIICGR